MIVGQPFVGHMIVPPHVERYTVTGHCQQKCTDAVSTLILLAMKICGACGHIQNCDCVCNNQLQDISASKTEKCQFLNMYDSYRYACFFQAYSQLIHYSYLCSQLFTQLCTCAHIVYTYIHRCGYIYSLVLGTPLQFLLPNCKSYNL